MEETLTAPATKLMNENNIVVRKITDSTAIDQETKTKALTELERLESTKDTLRSIGGRPAFSDTTTDVNKLFRWEDSPLGVEFWSHLQDAVFPSESRFC